MFICIPLDTFPLMPRRSNHGSRYLDRDDELAKVAEDPNYVLVMKNGQLCAVHQSLLQKEEARKTPTSVEEKPDLQRIALYLYEYLKEYCYEQSLDLLEDSCLFGWERLLIQSNPQFFQN